MPGHELPEWFENFGEPAHLFDPAVRLPDSELLDPDAA
jgi:hypothetical protein